MSLNTLFGTLFIFLGLLIASSVTVDLRLYECHNGRLRNQLSLLAIGISMAIATLGASMLSS